MILLSILCNDSPSVSNVRTRVMRTHESKPHTSTRHLPDFREAKRERLDNPLLPDSFFGSENSFLRYFDAAWSARWASTCCRMFQLLGSGNFKYHSQDSNIEMF